MRPGTVLVDVAVDQGGCIETCKPTTHQDPTFFIDDVLHYCVANMPGAVPYTSTLALTNATLPYAIQLANKGWKQACKDNSELKLGLNIIEGKVCYQGVAEAFDLDYTPVDEFLKIVFPFLDLNYKRYGDSGEYVVIVHGLFGMLDNWHNMAKKLSEHFQVLSIDVRNHGSSATS